VKMHGRAPVIRVARTEVGRCVASFQTDLLGSLYAVVFPESLTGALALHRFVAMIEHQYGKPVELRIDEPFAVRSKAVQEMLRSIAEVAPVAG
jgi:hypothetical protein